MLENILITESKNIIEILEKQKIDLNQIPNLIKIFNSQDNFTLAIAYCYNYGIIKGKRQERQNKKKHVHSDT